MHNITHWSCKNVLQRKKQLQIMTDLEKAKYIASEIQNKGINLCSTFDSWTEVAMSLADLGEDGRPIFHALASMDEQYKPGENERKFTNCLRTVRSIHFATFVRIAQLHGITLPKDMTGYKPTFRTRTPKPVQRAERVNPLPPECYKPYLKCRTLNNFVNGLVAEFGTYEDGTPYEDGLEALRRVYKDYKLCSSIHDHAKTVFFQIDKQGVFRCGKTMLYKPDLHRVRAEDGTPYRVGRTHTEQGFFKFEETPCLFGEHLLAKYPQAKVCVVESEKSAIIGAMTFPECVWVAMGGHSYRLMQTLKGRRVVLFPDADEWKNNRQGLERVKQDMAHVASRFDISAWADGEPEKSKKDVADHFLEAHKKPKRIAQEQPAAMIQTNTPPMQPQHPSGQPLQKTQQLAGHSPRQLEQQRVWQLIKAAHPASCAMLEQSLLLEIAS